MYDDPVAEVGVQVESDSVSQHVRLQPQGGGQGVAQAWTALSELSEFKYVSSLFHFRYTRRYSPLRGLTSSFCGWLRPLAKAFKEPFTLLFWLCFRPFLVFSSNLSKFSSNLSK